MRFATHLLPNSVAGTLLDQPESIVNACGSVGLHVRHQVGVDVHGDRDARMAESLLNDLRMHIGGQQMRCVGMPQPVKPEPTAASLHELHHGVGQAVRKQRTSVCLRHNVGFPVGPDAKPQ